MLGFGHHGVPSFIPDVLPHYFNGVADFLTREKGVEEVFEPQVGSVDSVQARSGELGDFIVRQGRDVHIIAHSMGGLDARMAVRRPEVRRHVRSITTIGTPHAGSEVAQAIFNRQPLNGVEIPEAVVAFLKLFGPALRDLTTGHVPHIDDVLESDRHLEIAGDASEAPRQSPLFRFAAQFGHIVGPNDGVVSKKSATLQRPLFDTWPFDHAGEVGWDLTTPLPRQLPGAPHLPRYGAIIDRLRTLGA